MKRKVLYGKMVILAPFQNRDMEYFKFLLEKDGEALWKPLFKEFQNYFSMLAWMLLQGKMFVWTALSNEGKASEPIGFILVEPISDTTVELHGISDKSIIKGLVRKIEMGKKTYAEDALLCMVDYLFEEFHKIEAQVFHTNRIARKLMEKAGFKREGTLREKANVDGKWLDLCLYGIINKRELIAELPKEEVEHGIEIETAVCS